MQICIEILIFGAKIQITFKLQISGPGCLQKVIEISETVRKITGCQRDMIYCSGSSEEAQKDINNLFQFVEMQLGF